jgi:hypothetical protein
MIEKFENWYKTLSNEQKLKLLDHIFNNKIKPLNEGIFSGPVTKIFAGPAPSKNICPLCKRTI